MKNPLLTGAASCLISGIFWFIILLCLWLESESSLGAAGVYILWIIVGAPLALIFTLLSFWLIYRKPNPNESQLVYSAKKAKVVSWSSLAMIIIPASWMMFLA